MSKAFSDTVVMTEAALTAAKLGILAFGGLLLGRLLMRWNRKLEAAAKAKPNIAKGDAEFLIRAIGRYAVFSIYAVAGIWRAVAGAIICGGGIGLVIVLIRAMLIGVWDFELDTDFVLLTIVTGLVADFVYEWADRTIELTN